MIITTYKDVLPDSWTCGILYEDWSGLAEDECLEAEHYYTNLLCEYLLLHPGKRVCMVVDETAETYECVFNGIYRRIRTFDTIISDY